MEQQVAVMSLKEQICTMAGIDPSELEEGESEFPEITVVTNQGLLDGAGSILLPSVQKEWNKIWFLFCDPSVFQTRSAGRTAHRRSPRGNLLSENGKGSQRNTG